MKRYDELTLEQQTKAQHVYRNKVINALIEQRIRFNDSDIVKRLDEAIEKAENNRTPWFLGEFILKDAVLKAMIISMALESAEVAIYLEDDEIAIRIDLIDKFKL